jgi:pyruvate-ferredoxin/flavodoxin oxidoreductase
MENGGERKNGRATNERRRVVAADAPRALALTEGAIVHALLLSRERHAVGVPAKNVFGGSVALEVIADPGALVRRAAERAAAGERVALIATAKELTRARLELAEVAGRRLGIVAHALAGEGIFHAVSLADLGWGMLFACGAEEASDLSLVARRAAEDCGTPFFVVHERERTGAHLEPLAPPDTELCETFVGAPGNRVRRADDPAHPSHAEITSRAFAERVPFALGSALRELESLTGRRHDSIERFPAAEFHVAFVALGRIGDSLVSAVERFRAEGHDVGAVKITALRPFAGPRLVKTLSRALAVTVLETIDEPLAQSNPLTREVKAAFADAITWAPGYPGVGRVPRILSGVADIGDHALEARDLDAILHNMLADERGKRSFVLGAPEAHSIPPPVPARSSSSPRQFTMRGRVADGATAAACAEVAAAVLSVALGLRVRASARALQSGEGEGFAFDVVAARERPRGTHAPHAVRLIALDEASALVHGNPLGRLAEGGIVALPTAAQSPDAIWAELPPYAKAIVHDRNAKLLGYPLPDALARDRWTVAAAFVALALSRGPESGRPPLASPLVEREIVELLESREGLDEATAKRAGAYARRVFESVLEVPRAVIDRDREGVELGRRDSRAATGAR